MVGSGGIPKGNSMVVSEIRSLYRGENDLFRTVLKRIYEEWDADQEQWCLKRIEFIYEDPELLVPSDAPAVVVEQRHGWLDSVNCQSFTEFPLIFLMKPQIP